MITGAQIRAARALLDWSARDLSQASRVSPATIQRIERTQGVLATAQARTLLDLQKVLEEAGVEFIGAPEDRPGVRLLRTGSA
jgi:transcriptional regulator with XRE-family HTH domain